MSIKHRCPCPNLSFIKNKKNNKISKMTINCSSDDFKREIKQICEMSGWEGFIWRDGENSHMRT